jgi:hypothetical protein
MAQKQYPTPRLLDWSILTSVLLGCGPSWFRSHQAAHGFHDLRIHP